MTTAVPFLRRKADEGPEAAGEVSAGRRQPLPVQRRDAAERRATSAAAVDDADSRRRRTDLAIILLGALIYTSLPSFADIQLGGRLPVAEHSTGPVIATDTGEQLRTLVTPLPYLVFLIILLRNLRLGGRRIGSAMLFAAFCTMISLASFVSIGDATFAFRVVAVVVASVWIVAPRADDFVVFGRFGVAVALLSMMLAAGGFNGWMAEGAGGGKGIFVERLLAGPFPQMNVLGMALAVALPLTALLSSALSRFIGFSIVAAALLLTSSRTALLSATVAMIVYLLVRAVRGRTRMLMAWSAVAAAAVAIAVLPWTTDDPDAFTKRGLIWLTSRELLPGNWLFGLGISAYSVGGPVTRAGHMSASWHGHNILVTSLVMGGVVTAALFLVLFLVALHAAIKQIDTCPALMASALTLLTMGLAETPVRFDTFDGAAWMTWTALAGFLFLRSEPSSADESETDLSREQTPTAGPSADVRGIAYTYDDRSQRSQRLPSMRDAGDRTFRPAHDRSAQLPYHRDTVLYRGSQQSESAARENPPLRRRTAAERPGLRPQAEQTERRAAFTGASAARPAAQVPYYRDISIRRAKRGKNSAGE